MLRFVLLILLLTTGCDRSKVGAPADTAGSADVRPTGPVKPGAQVLADQGFGILQGKRVGLIANHTARVDTIHVLDLLHTAPEVELVALFGPEHGLRGSADAGAKIEHGRDEVTGVPIYSLYGDTQKPTQEMLKDVDVLVFDIQDVGARFYTYISTMGYSMQAAAEAGIPFVVLDRPNPLGGELVSGFLLDRKYESFVGLYPIPIVHGMSVGELARMIQEEEMLPGLASLQLEVIPAEGWERDMLWPETGLPWIPPSPNIPGYSEALVYPGAGFFEATSASEGRGTTEPFTLVGAPWADAQLIADTLTARGLPGIRFEPETFVPKSIEGMASSPKLRGTTVHGIRHVVTDPSVFRPVETGVHVLHAFYHHAPAAERDGFISRPEWLARLSGTDRFYEMLVAGARPEAIIAAWQDEVAAFRERRAAVLIYE